MKKRLLSSEPKSEYYVERETLAKIKHLVDSTKFTKNMEKMLLDITRAAELQTVSVQPQTRLRLGGMGYAQV